jgi:IS30 family transposase
MDDRLRDLIEDLPEPEPRSCLDPFRELIDELHRRGRTYRGIAHILAERCEVLVSVSTVYRFIQSRSQKRPQPCRRQSPQIPKMAKLSQLADTEQKVTVNPGRGSASDEIQRRIETLKLRPLPVQTKSQPFQYDPDEPLHLPLKIGKSRSDT